MKVKNFVLGVGIFIVFMLALAYGIQAFSPAPEYEDFCDRQSIIPRNINANCSIPLEVEVKQQACYQAGGDFVLEYDNQGCVVDGYCDECRILYEDARSEYLKKVFVISLIVGVLTLIIGVSILSVEPVGSALLGSGIGAIVYGSIRNWTNLSNIWRFLLLILALVLLVWMAIRINKKGRKKGLKALLQFWKR